MASVTLHSLYSRVSGDPSGGYSSVVLQSQDLQGERGRERCHACSVNAKVLPMLELPPGCCGESGKQSSSSLEIWSGLREGQEEPETGSCSRGH